ncbi:hypothetical protein GCM10007171_04000 [Dickeya fangzhongdai]|nr:hypothetical protein GCM10007171_04000 [Dickeya fangzhongdai]
MSRQDSCADADPKRGNRRTEHRVEAGRYTEPAMPGAARWGGNTGPIFYVPRRLVGQRFWK